MYSLEWLSLNLGVLFLFFNNMAGNAQNITRFVSGFLVAPSSGGRGSQDNWRIPITVVSVREGAPTFVRVAVVLSLKLIFLFDAEIIMPALFGLTVAGRTRS